MSAAKRRRASSSNVQDSEAEARRLLKRAISVSSLHPLLQLQKQQPEECADGVVTIEGSDEFQTSPHFSQHTSLPTIEQLSPHLHHQAGRIREAFLHDIRPNDVICARVARCGVGVMELELVCMLTRFRRCIEAFMKGERFHVLFDRSKRAYRIRDHVRGHVITTDPLTLRIDEDEVCMCICRDEGKSAASVIPPRIEAILKFDDELPAYYREWRRARDSSTEQQSGHDGEDVIKRMKKNPNLSELLQIRIDSPHFSTLRGLVPGPSARTADDLRREQTFKLAMEHVKRGAELTREGKCFEATQLFNKALNVDDGCVDAYVGRGAACAGEKNYKAALADFDRALQLDPTHRNASKYRIEVLIAYGKDLEREGSVNEAREKYQRAAHLSNGCDSRAVDALRRLAQNEKNGKRSVSGVMAQMAGSSVASSTTAYNQIELIDLSGEGEDEGSREEAGDGESDEANGLGRRGVGELRAVSEVVSNEEAERSRNRLREIEDFIAKLKASK